MARWLVEASSLHSTHSGGLYTSVFVGIGGLLMSLCGAILILGMCSLCYTRKTVRDKASSSDGDVSPAKQDAAACKKNPAYSLSNVIEVEREEVFNTEQQPGKSPHVWQRAILMGERCQRPTFSGLVLYDEKGDPLPRVFVNMNASSTYWRISSQSMMRLVDQASSIRTPENLAGTVD